MSGYVAMHRGWQDHSLFAGDEFSRRDAWAWLILEAAWKPATVRIKGSTVELERGELCFSQRFLAERWGWSKSRVDRFIAQLRSEGMIETRSKSGATAGHPAGQGQSIISICNYAKYQDAQTLKRGNGVDDIGATAGQRRGKEEEGNKGRREQGDGVAPDGAAAGYAFEGKVIRLTRSDFDKWSRSFSGIDLRAQLQSRDDWLASDDGAQARQRWFHSTSSWLAKKQQEAASQRDSVPAGQGMSFVDIVLREQSLK